MRRLLCLGVLLGLGRLAVRAGAAPTEEFVGPLPGWKNLKIDFGAVGDGKANDTAAFQRGLDALPLHGTGKADDARVLFLPAGTYRITAPLVFTNRMAIADHVGRKGQGEGRGCPSVGPGREGRPGGDVHGTCG